MCFSNYKTAASKNEKYLKIPYQLVVNGTKIGHFGVKLSIMNEQSVINYSSRAKELGSVNERETDQTCFLFKIEYKKEKIRNNSQFLINWL